MGMSTGRNESDPIMEINTTPLIDVMLVLLVTLILMVPVMTHATKLDMPRAPTAAQTEPLPVIALEIDFDGAILWNGTQVPDWATLERYYRIEAQKTPQPELHLRANKSVEYDYVIRAIALAQRNGIRRIGFVSLT